jgi:hypothetical protein
MGCFIVPGAAALLTTAFGKHVPEYLHINWLNLLLWGGTSGLVIDHIYNGEYPWTMTSSAVGEVATLGTAVLAGCVAIWLAAVVIHNRINAPSS